MVFARIPAMTSSGQVVVELYVRAGRSPKLWTFTRLFRASAFRLRTSSVSPFSLRISARRTDRASADFWDVSSSRLEILSLLDARESAKTLRLLPPGGPPPAPRELWGMTVHAW